MKSYGNAAQINHDSVDIIITEIDGKYNTENMAENDSRHGCTSFFLLLHKVNRGGNRRVVRGMAISRVFPKMLWWEIEKAAIYCVLKERFRGISQQKRVE